MSHIYKKYLKRWMDILCSFSAILLLLPVFLLTAFLVRVRIGSPVLFKQRRPGFQEKLFTLYKLRTMTNQRDEKGELFPDVCRLNRFGSWLRSTSLDELPELWNILKGDMSLVGPRPLLERYLPLYDENQKRRHEAKPGLTGLAQIKGRNALSWEEKFQLDVEYVDNISFLGDIKIILLTVRKVLLREGIHSATAVTMEPFTGSKKSNELGNTKM